MYVPSSAIAHTSLPLLTPHPLVTRGRYREANLLLGDIPKVTPSSKVVGDLAQFMVSQNLTPEMVIEQAESLALPQSVVEYFQGQLGVPPGGFPEPLRTRVLAGRGGAIEGRPGASLEDFDFEESTKILKERCVQSPQISMHLIRSPRISPECSHKCSSADLG